MGRKAEEWHGGSSESCKVSMPRALGMSVTCSGDELWECISRECHSGSLPVPLESDFPPGSSGCGVQQHWSIPGMPLAPPFALSAGLPWLSCDSIKPRPGSWDTFGTDFGAVGALGGASILAFKTLKCSVNQQTPH